MSQGRAEIRALLRRHDVRPRTSLGQHFLADPNLVAKIVALSGVGPDDRVLEIGAGTGTLTRALASTGARVVAYEVDERLRPVLAESLAGVTGVELRFEDATRVAPAELLPTGGVLVANLPYHAGTPLLLDLVRNAPRVRRFVVMVQREVANRLTADPGTREYGVPSIVMALHTVSLPGRFRVGPAVFIPVPAVESVVVGFDRVPAPPHAEAAVDLAAAAFGRRRKMLRRSLDGVVDDPEQVLRDAGIDPTLRAEQLRPEDYVALAARVAA